MVGQALGPTFWGPTADRLGRRMTIFCTLCFYLAINVALALTRNGAMLLALRVFQAFGSASLISRCAGVISDVLAPSGRGKFMGCNSALRNVTVAIGPIFGGLLISRFGWRSIFWCLTILAGLLALAVFLFLPKTLRRIAGNGSVPLQSWYRRPLECSKVVLTGSKDVEDGPVSQNKPPDAPLITWRTFFEPFCMLREPGVACALLYGAFVYAASSMMLASMLKLFRSTYGFSTLQ
jgi:MFS family permease